MRSVSFLLLPLLMLASCTGSKTETHEAPAATPTETENAPFTTKPEPASPTVTVSEYNGVDGILIDRVLTAEEARTECPKDTHQAGVREMAEIAKKYGAKDFIEFRELATSHYNDKERLIQTLDAEKKRDAFYLDPKGYRQPLSLSGLEVRSVFTASPVVVPYDPDPSAISSYETVSKASYVFDLSYAAIRVEQDQNAKGGVFCIKGEAPQPTHYRKSRTGFLFAVDTRNPKLGLAIHDLTSHLVWGDIAPNVMDIPTAEKYCKDMGAQLPTTVVFEDLAGRLTADAQRPEISYENIDWLTYPALNPVIPNFHYLFLTTNPIEVFDGTSGELREVPESPIANVRCIVNSSDLGPLRLSPYEGVSTH